MYVSERGHGSQSEKKRGIMKLIADFWIALGLIWFGLFWEIAQYEFNLGIKDYFSSNYES